MRVGLCSAMHREFIEQYRAILQYNGIESVDLDPNDSDFWKQCREVDAFIFRWKQEDTEKQIAKAILPVVENHLGIFCFPNQKTCWHYDDKIRQYYVLSQHGFPVIDSFIFWNREAALAWAQQASYPCVFKLSSGASSQGVLLVESASHAMQLIRTMFQKGVFPEKMCNGGLVRFQHIDVWRELYRILRWVRSRFTGEDFHRLWQRQKNYVLFQKFLPHNDYDTRITVIGRRAFGYRRNNRKGDFRASGSGDFLVEKKLIDERCVKTALDISRALGFQSMAYDFVYDEDNQVRICEISYTYVDWMVHSCPGYWDSNLVWHEGSFWPSYFHLVDLLQRPQLSQPVLTR